MITHENLPNLLRQVRAAIGISQLELALRLGVSQRHVCFVEQGRARPSRHLLLAWMRETGASADEQNAAMLSAGYSPTFVELAPQQARRTPAFRALSDMITAHEPFPGLVFDADWMICAMNETGQWLCTIMMSDYLASIDGPPTEMDMIASVAHPGGLLSKVRNAPEIAYALLRQFRAEALVRPALSPRIDAYEREVRRRYGTEPADLSRAAGDPYLNLVLDLPGATMTFLLVQTVFGLPQNVSQASLRTELWFPVDQATRRLLMTRADRAATNEGAPEAEAWAALCAG